MPEEALKSYEFTEKMGLYRLCVSLLLRQAAQKEGVQA